jgi:sec-independent protein translocase protein TatB
MFGLSFGEIVIIAVLALLLLGPDRLPEAAKTLGKGLRDIRKATEDLKDQVEREIDLDGKKALRPALVPPVPAGPPVPGAAGPPPAAAPDNVPGLEAALAEPPGAEPAAAPTPGAEPVGVREPTAEDVAAAAVPLSTVREPEGTKA